MAVDLASGGHAMSEGILMGLTCGAKISLKATLVLNCRPQPHQLVTSSQTMGVECYEVSNYVYVPPSPSSINLQHLNFRNEADRRKRMKHVVNPSWMQINWQL